MDPLVSVVVPVYNASSYLDASISSIISQTYSNLEIILVNDGSKDNSGILCQKYSEEDNRVVFINNLENKGLSHTRNCALDIMKGEYLLFVDSDDSLTPNAIEVLVDSIKSRNVDIIGFNAKKIKNGIADRYIKYNYNNECLSGEKYLIRMLELDHIYEPVWLYFYKTDFVKENNIRFIENRIFEDEIWVPEVFLKASKASYINFDAYNYYIRPQSIMTRTDIDEKKYNDTVLNCHHLAILAESLSDSRDRDIFKDYIARMYMSGARFIGYEKSKNDLIEFDFINELISEKTTRIKYTIFRLNRKLYFKLKELMR